MKEEDEWSCLHANKRIQTNPAHIVITKETNTQYSKTMKIDWFGAHVENTKQKERRNKEKEEEEGTVATMMWQQEKNTRQYC